jgi:hypothetical protein
MIRDWGCSFDNEERPMTTFDSVGTDQDLWHVEVAPDDVRVVTLDQLDQAFQDGLVNESMRIWQEGMPCAVSLGELLGAGNDEETEYGEEPAYEAGYAPQQYALQQYAQQQYAQPQYAQQQYAQPQYAQQQYAQPQYAQPVQYAPPQYVPARSAPPPSRTPESSWPPVIARSETPPPVSYASTPVPPSMAPMALDVGDLDIEYPRSGGGKGKFLLAAVVLLGAGGFVAFQNRGALGLTPTTAAAAVQAPAPTPPPQPASHAYDPGPPVKVGESKPPLTLTTREPEDKKADVKKLDELQADNKVDAKKVMASGKKPKAAPRTHRNAPSSKPAGTGFKLGKSGSKYDPLNGSL